MFWKYNSPSSTQIDTLLQKEDVTLQELMEEEELLQECRGQNKKVVDFLLKPEILEELVHMVVEEPSSEKELQVRFKPANLASDLLTCDVPAIIEKLLSSNLLLILYKFLEKEKPLNPLMASFVAKVFSMLIMRRPDQNWYTYQWICFQVLEFFKSQDNFVEVAVRHIGTSAILDLLSKLICGVDSDDQDIRLRIHTWLNECELVEKLLQKLTPDCDSEEHSSVDQLLCELTHSCRESSTNGKETQPNGSKSSLLITLESDAIVNKLLDVLLLENRNTSSVSHVINILLALLSNKSTNHQAHFQHVLSIDFISNVINNRSVVQTILQRLPEILQILSTPIKLGPLLTSYGKEVERLGSMKLQITNLIACLIATNDLMVHTKLAELSILQVLMDLFFKFSLNNFLHTQVSRCIVSLLQNSLTSSEEASPSPLVANMSNRKDAQIDGLNNNNLKNNGDVQSAVTADVPQVDAMQVQSLSESDGGVENMLETNRMETVTEDQQVPSSPLENYSSHPLLVQLFNECQIIQQLLENFQPEQNPEISSQKSHNMCGYMGHLRDIANTLVNACDNGPNSNLIKSLIQSIPEKIQPDWEEFCLITLAEVNLRNKVIPIQAYRDSEFDQISEFRSVGAFIETIDKAHGLETPYDDFKNTMENIRDANFDDEEQPQKEKSEVYLKTYLENMSINFDEEETTQENDDLFLKMCSERSKLSEDEYEDMWQFKKEVSLAVPEKVDASEENADSSPEEENIDDEFDSLRSTPKEVQQSEKMDVDDIGEDEWSKVFDKRESSESIEEINPWESAPVCDTSGANNWASFASSSLGAKDKFCAFSEIRTQGFPTTFDPFAMSTTDSSQPPQTEFFPICPTGPVSVSNSSSTSNQESCDGKDIAAGDNLSTEIDSQNDAEMGESIASNTIVEQKSSPLPEVQSNIEVTHSSECGGISQASEIEELDTKEEVNTEKSKEFTTVSEV